MRTPYTSLILFQIDEKNITTVVLKKTAVMMIPINFHTIIFFFCSNHNIFRKSIILSKYHTVSIYINKTESFFKKKTEPCLEENYFFH